MNNFTYNYMICAKQNILFKKFLYFCNLIIFEFFFKTILFCYGIILYIYFELNLTHIFSIYLGAIKGVQQKKKAESITTDVNNEKTKLKKDNKQGLFDKPIDELVNFIEGNKATNEKRAAKKARRREKKVHN